MVSAASELVGFERQQLLRQLKVYQEHGVTPLISKKRGRELAANLWYRNRDFIWIYSPKPILP